MKFAAFTGKAASVMRGKGCRDASTIHGLIYRARESGDREFERPRHADLGDDVLHTLAAHLERGKAVGVPGSHLTRAFSATLGPFVLRAIG